MCSRCFFSIPISRSGGCIPDVVVFFVPGTPLIWNSKDMCGFFNGSDQSPIGSDIGSESPKVFPQLTSFGARFVSLSPLCCRLGSCSCLDFRRRGAAIDGPGGVLIFPKANYLVYVLH